MTTNPPQIALPQHPWGGTNSFIGLRAEVTVECWEGFSLACVCDWQPDVMPSRRDPNGEAESIEVLEAVAVDEQGNRGGNIASMLNPEQTKRVEEACLRELNARGRA